MIRDYNIANDANIQLHKILGATLSGRVITGEIFWVGDSGDAAYDAMRSKVPADKLYTDLDDCVGACTAKRGDIICCLEGYNMAIAAAGDLDLDVAGLTIVFLGTGTSQAKITFGTAVSADMDVDAADITLIRPKFVAAVDALTGPIDVNSTDFTIIDGEYHDATNIDTTDCIIAVAGATRLKIDGWKYFRANEGGTQKQSNIQLNGVDDCVLENIDIRGDFATGNIENLTDEVLNIRLKNLILDNLNSGPIPGIVLDSAADGHAQDVHIRVASGTTFVSNVADINWGKNCLGFSTDGYGGTDIGTAAATGIEGTADTIASDLIIVDTVVDTVASDLIVVDTVVDTIASDLIIVDTVVDTIASDLIVLDALVDAEVVKTATIASDLIILDTVADTIASDLIVLDALVDAEVVKTATIASDLVILDTVADTIASDLIVLDALVDAEVVKTATIASDLIVLDGVVDAWKTEWDTFESLVSDFIVKYESDNP